MVATPAGLRQDVHFAPEARSIPSQDNGKPAQSRRRGAGDVPHGAGRIAVFGHPIFLPRRVADSVVSASQKGNPRVLAHSRPEREWEVSTPSARQTSRPATDPPSTHAPAP